MFFTLKKCENSFEKFPHFFHLNKSHLKWETVTFIEQLKIAYVSSFCLVSTSDESWKTAPLSRTCSRIALIMPSTVVKRPPRPEAPNSLSNSGISILHVSDCEWNINRHLIEKFIKNP